MADDSPSGSSPVHVKSIEHQLTRDEVVPVFYWQLLRRWQVFILPISGICLVIASAVVLGLDSDDTVAWAVMLALGVVILIIFSFIVPLTPARIWKRVGPHFEVRTLEVSNEGIQRHAALNDSMMRWPMFSEATQRDDLYLLRVGRGPGCFIVPKRAFSSESDEIAFRGLVEQFTPAHLNPIGT
jgi:hypothetical protein